MATLDDDFRQFVDDQRDFERRFIEEQRELDQQLVDLMLRANDAGTKPSDIARMLNEAYVDRQRRDDAFPVDSERFSAQWVTARLREAQAAADWAVERLTRGD